MAYVGCVMLVQPLWTLDIETIVGVGITLLVVLAVQFVFWYLDRRREGRSVRDSSSSPWSTVGRLDQVSGRPIGSQARGESIRGRGTTE